MLKPNDGVVPASDDEWHPFLSRAKEIVRDIEEADYKAIFARWKLGVWIVDWQDEKRGRPDWYGSKFVERVASHVGIHYKTVYQCMAVARKFRTEESFKDYISLLRASNYLTWDHVRNRALPPVSDSEESVGTKEAQADQVMGIVEASVMSLERYVSRGVPDEHREEVVGLLEGMSDSIESIKAQIQDESRRLEPDYEIIPRDGPDEKTFESWVRKQNCAVCGRGGQIESCHLPHTKGAGHNDRAQVPLCIIHHREQHQSLDTFMKHWGMRLMEWWAEWPFRFWKEYYVRSVGDEENDV